MVFCGEVVKTNTILFFLSLKEENIQESEEEIKNVNARGRSE